MGCCHALEIVRGGLRGVLMLAPSVRAGPRGSARVHMGPRDSARDRAGPRRSARVRTQPAETLPRHAHCKAKFGRFPADLEASVMYLGDFPATMFS